MGWLPDSGPYAAVALVAYDAAGVVDCVNAGDGQSGGQFGGGGAAGPF